MAVSTLAWDECTECWVMKLTLTCVVTCCLLNSPVALHWCDFELILLELRQLLMMYLFAPNDCCFRALCAFTYLLTYLHAGDGDCRVYTAARRLQTHTLCGSNHRLEREHGDAQRVGVISCLISRWTLTRAGKVENLTCSYMNLYSSVFDSNNSSHWNEHNTTEW